MRSHTYKAMCYCVSGSRNRNLGKIVAASSAALAILLIVATVVFFVRMNVLKRRRGRCLCVNINLGILVYYRLFKLQVLKFIAMLILPPERRQFGALLNTVNKSKLNMPYEILEKATHYFNDANKLGEGGSGSVYKVITSDLIYHYLFYHQIVA